MKEQLYRTMFIPESVRAIKAVLNAATAGTAIFAGVQSGKNYQKDLYLDDVAGARVNWDDSGAGASATTLENWIPPEDVVLVDLAIVTGAAQTRLQVVIDGVATGDTMRHVVQVDTSVGRPRVNLGVAAGHVISIIQLA